MIYLGDYGISDSNSVTIGGQHGIIGSHKIKGNGGGSPYVFYTVYPNLTEQITNKDPSVVLSAGRWNDEGEEFGENEAVIDSNSVNVGPKAYDVLNGKTNDISVSPWYKSRSSIITENFFKALEFGSAILQTISTFEGSEYTLSFNAWVEDGGQCTGYAMYHEQSATGFKTDITLSYTPTRYSITVLGRTGDGQVIFGFQDRNSSNWSKVYIDTINVTQSSYALPPVINNTTGPVTTSDNYATADEGIKYQIKPDEYGSVYTGKVVGDELVTNGDCSSLDGWNSVSGGILSLLDNRLKCAMPSGGGWGKVGQLLTTVVGESYAIDVDCFVGTMSDNQMSYRVGTTAGGIDVFNIPLIGDTVVKRKTFIATSTTSYLYFASYSDNTEGHYFEVSNISVKQVSRNMGNPDLLDALDGKADGVELVTNGGFDTETGWTKSAAVTISNGKANFVSTDLGANDLYQDVGLQDGVRYEVVVACSDYTSGNLSVWAGGSQIAGDNASITTAVGTFVLRIDLSNESSSNGKVVFGSVGSTEFVGSIDNISIKKISPAEGKMTMEWTPMISQSQYSGTEGDGKRIISFGNSNDTGLFQKPSDPSFYLQDAKKWLFVFQFFWTARTKYTIIGQWGKHPDYADAPKMQLKVTDGTTVWQSDVKDFDGSFDPGDNLSLGWGNPYWFKLGKLVIEKSPRW